MADIKKRTTRAKARKARPRSPKAAATGQEQPGSAVQEPVQPAAAVAAEPAAVVEATAPETTPDATPSQPLLPRSVDGPLLEHLMRETSFRAKVISLVVKKLTG